MNPDIASAKPQVLAALRRADAIVGIADLHGWKRPQAYTDSLAMLNAAREIERAVPTLPKPPQTPAGIRKWVDATVEVRHQEAARRDVIDQLVLTWERETAAAGLAATADYTARLADVFDELVEKFDAHADAPRQLSGHESPAELEAHTSALRVASEMSNALLMRATLADAAQESEDIGPDHIWLVLAPHAQTTRDGVQNALAQFKQRIPQSLSEWDEIRPLGLRLAHLGEVAARRQRHSDLMYTIAMSTPDMGQRDHSYGEIEGNPDGPALGLQRQAETDAMFDQSPSLSI